ncbi:MAG: hypothetical protein U0163_04145 [Gemmatimonadaceae bacterium]
MPGSPLYGDDTRQTWRIRSGISGARGHPWGVDRSLRLLGIPVDFKDSQAGILVAERFQVRRELKKVPLSRYFDCGQGMNGVNANIYRLTLVVASWITPLHGDPNRRCRSPSLVGSAQGYGRQQRTVGLAASRACWKS